MDQSDLEDTVADWLEDHDVDGAYDLAGVLAGSGLDPAWADGVAAGRRGRRVGAGAALARLHGRDRAADA
jgi:hypothetical protein